jgi:hypothetical protein
VDKPVLNWQNLEADQKAGTTGDLDADLVESPFPCLRTALPTHHLGNDMDQLGVGVRWGRKIDQVPNGHFIDVTVKNKVNKLAPFKSHRKPLFYQMSDMNPNIIGCYPSTSQVPDADSGSAV